MVRGTHILVAGLGNLPLPMTRHSVGHFLIDSLVTTMGTRLVSDRTGFTVDCTLSGAGTSKTITFLKPKALMNICGYQVSSTLRRAGLLPFSLIVIHDSLEHAPMTLSPKFDGSANGHNGVRDVIRALGNDAKFHRLRIGIGRDRSEDVADYVLGRLSTKERTWWGPEGEGTHAVWGEIKRIAGEIDQRSLGEEKKREVKNKQKKVEASITRQPTGNSFKSIRCMYCGSRDHHFNDHPGSSGPYLQQSEDGSWRNAEGKNACVMWNGPRGCALRLTCVHSHICSLCGSTAHGAQACPVVSG